MTADKFARLPYGTLLSEPLMESVVIHVRCVLLPAVWMLAACTDMLPRSQTEVQAPWSSFEEARTALESLESRNTTGVQVRASGFDPFTNPNVELLNYSDILRRFPLAGSIARIDAGLRECMEAGKTCVGYSIELRKTHSERVGPFLLDLLSFRRETKITGWSFSGVILLVDDRVVYSLYGGKPAISEMEMKFEPLGPLQDWNGSSLVH